MEGDNGMVAVIKNGSKKKNLEDNSDEDKEILELQGKVEEELKKLADVYLQCKRENDEQRKHFQEIVESHMEQSYKEDLHKKLQEIVESHEALKIETWYYTTEKEAYLHVKFDKYLESCSFITHDSSLAKDLPLLESQKPIEFGLLPKELIMTGLQRRIDRLKELHTIDILFKFISFVIERRNDDDLSDDELKYLDTVDTDTIIYGDTWYKSLVRKFSPEQLDSSLAKKKLDALVESKRKEIAQKWEIKEYNGYFYYKAYTNLQKEFGKHDMQNLEGINNYNTSLPCLKPLEKQAGISNVVVMDNLGADVESSSTEDMAEVVENIGELMEIEHGFDEVKARNEEDTQEDLENIEDLEEIEQGFDLHKKRKKGHHGCEHASNFTPTTGNLSSSGWAHKRVVQNADDLKKALELEIELIQDQIFRTEYSIFQGKIQKMNGDDGIEKEGKIQKMNGDDGIEKENFGGDDWMKGSQGDLPHSDSSKPNELDDGSQEKVSEQYQKFDQYLSTIIKHDSSPTNIYDKAWTKIQDEAMNYSLITSEMASVLITMKIEKENLLDELGLYARFLKDLIVYEPHVKGNFCIYEIRESVKTIIPAQLPDFRVRQGLSLFRSLLYELELIYHPEIRKGLKSDLENIIDAMCRIDFRSRCKFRNWDDGFREEIIKNLPNAEVRRFYKDAKELVPLHAKFELHLAACNIIKHDSPLDSLYDNVDVVPKEYERLGRNLIMDSLKSRQLILKKMDQADRFENFVVSLVKGNRECLDLDLELRDEFENKNVYKLPKHEFIEGILIYNSINKAKLESMEDHLASVKFVCAMRRSSILQRCWESDYYEHPIYEVPLSETTGIEEVLSRSSMPHVLLLQLRTTVLGLRLYDLVEILAGSLIAGGALVLLCVLRSGKRRARIKHASGLILVSVGDIAEGFVEGEDGEHRVGAVILFQGGGGGHRGFSRGKVIGEASCRICRICPSSLSRISSTTSEFDILISKSAM